MIRLLVLMTAATLIFVVALSAVKILAPSIGDSNERVLIAVVVTTVLIWLIGKER